MKSVAPDAGGLVPPRNRHDLGDPRHVMMKAGVEAGDLRQPRQQSLESFDQSDLRREMVDVERADPAQFRDQLGRDQSPERW